MIQNNAEKSRAISSKYEKKSVKRLSVAESVGYCLNCKAQLSFCGKPFTAEIPCIKCGAVNIYEESQQAVRLKVG